MSLRKLSSERLSASIVIPAFDQRPEYLEAAIQSAIACFDGASYEIIVCDDGSNSSISKEYVGICRTSDAKLIRLNRNMGMNAARNFAVLQAQGQFIVLLDSDDLLVGDWNKIIGSIMQTQPRVAFADHCQYNVDLSRRIQDRKKSAYFEAYYEFAGTVYDPFLHSTFLFHPQIYRRDLFIESGGFDCEYSSGDEIALQLKMLRGGSDGDLKYFAGEHYQYRKNPDSAVHRSDLYEKLISNIERIIAREIRFRHGLNVNVSRHGREVEFGAAHYSISVIEDSSNISPPWFDNQSLGFTDRHLWRHRENDVE